MIAMLMASPSYAQTRSNIGDFEGSWQQVTSNAGQCARCEIAISGTGRSLGVTANNGWATAVSFTERAAMPALSGSGRWNPDGRSIYRGKRIQTIFVLIGDTLHMTMTIEVRASLTRTIRATFKRPWLGA